MGLWRFGWLASFGMPQMVLRGGQWGYLGAVVLQVLRHLLPYSPPALSWQTIFDILLSEWPVELICENFCGS